MLFVKLEDATNSAELLIFPRLLKETAALWVSGQAVIAEGKVSEKDQEAKFLANRVMPLDPLSPQASIDAFKKVMLENPPKPAYRPKNGNGYEGNGNGKASAPAPRSESVPVVSKPLRLILLQDMTAERLDDMRRVFASYPGSEEVYFRVTEEGKSRIIKTAFRVDNSSRLNDEIKEHFSEVIKIAE